MSSSASAIWKLEPQQRGAPHFHLLVWGICFSASSAPCPNCSPIYRPPLFPTAVPRWFEIVGNNDPRHLAAGTRVEAVRSRNGVMRYASLLAQSPAAAGPYTAASALHGKRFRDAAGLPFRQAQGPERAEGGTRRAILGHHWPGRSTPLSVRNLRRAFSRDDSLSPDRAALPAGQGPHAPEPRSGCSRSSISSGRGFWIGPRASRARPWKRSLRRQPPSGARSGPRRCGAMFPPEEGFEGKRGSPLASTPVGDSTHGQPGKYQ